MELHYTGPVVLAILDGVGLKEDAPGNAVAKARMSWLSGAVKKYPHMILEASGEAVGLLPMQMGNSEVGHNTMGVGHAYKQGIARVNEAFAEDEVYVAEAWREAIKRVVSKASGADVAADIDVQHTLHFAGIFSDGGVHSDIYYMEQMIAEALKEGVRRIRVHAVLDGRDTPPYSALEYIERFNKFVKELTKEYEDADIRIASGGGRMVFVADRYENDWNVVARGWDAIVNGRADYYFESPEEAVETLRRLFPDKQDQDLPAFVIVERTASADEMPVGKVRKGDSFIYFDFRADRAIEIAQAFTYWDFPYFNRGGYQPTDVYFVGMTEYNSDTHVPEHRLIEPVKFGKSLSEHLSEHGISQFACSETVKFGHVTYYFDGNSYEKHEKEEFREIESFAGPYENRPWMKSADITDEIIGQMSDYRFVRANYPGGDIVGHTANFEATVIALEAIDLSLGRLAQEVDKLGGALIVVADHGNAEELLDDAGKKKTSHTTNGVPFLIYDNTNNRYKYALCKLEHAGLSNLASTIAMMLGVEPAPEWDPPLIAYRE